MLTIPVDSRLPLPLYEQIYRYLKQEIQDGRLACGSRLPSTRSLSGHLGVSRNTVDTAYSQLLSEGYLEAFPKRGYFVSQISNLVQIRTPEKPAPIRREAEKEPVIRYDFSPFSVDLSHFPYHTWRQLSKNCLSDNGQLFLLGDNQGDEALRRALCLYLHQSRGVTCTEDQLVVGAGADYLLQLLCTILKKPVPVAMENPTYIRAYRIFCGLGFPVRPVSLDEQGLSVGNLLETDASLVYVTPSHQYPLGTVMPIKRRMELLSWAAAEPGRYIIEDDHDSEFRYKGKPIPSLQGIDSRQRVIYIGTFSRAIAPAIRIGYMVLPPPLLTVYREQFSYYSCTVSRIDQAILEGFIEKGYFERHLNRMRTLYKARQEVMVQSLKRLGGTVSLSGLNAGLYVVARLRLPVTEEEIKRKAADTGIRLYGLSDHYIGPPPKGDPAFLMGYANLTEQQIREGADALVSLLAKEERMTQT